MRRSGKLLFLILVIIFVCPVIAQSASFSERFSKGGTSIGVDFGIGYTFDLPPGRDRSDLTFGFIFPSWQENLTGVIAQDSLLQGALYWQVEAGMAFLTHRDHEYLLGISPLMVEYKFVNPKRKWAPTLLAGAGFSMTNWKDQAEFELGSEFEFLLHLGGGIEVFRESGSYSFNYRLFHVSNAGMQRPNIGLNAHVFSLGFHF